MSITTQSCKDFIIQISKFIGVSENDSWKRVKKYKQDGMVFRDFKNKQGKTLTICEHGGELSLYSLYSSVDEVQNEEVILEFVEPGMKYIGIKTTEQDVAQFLAECANQHAFIADNNAAQWAKISKNWILDSVTTNHHEESYELNYSDTDGYSISIDKEEVSKIYVFVLDPIMYDTTYRYSVFETTGNYLCLGTNNSD